MRFTARYAATGQPTVVEVVGDRVTYLGPGAEPADGWIAPSFCDVQINGCLGVGFNSPRLTAEGVRTAADECRRHGVGRFCPTVITDGFEAIRRSFATLAGACDADPELAHRTVGFHLEGPYISGDDGPRGAHPRPHARDPDWDEFRRWQDAAGGRIRMVTLAPERVGAVPFIEKLAAAGVVVALGHTAATGEQIRAAVDAGARASTHLGNGCHATLDRHVNPIWEQLADDRLWMSVITDGHHLPPAVLTSLVRAKGVGRTLLTCDASPLAGLPPGRYADWGQEFEVLPTGKIVVPGTPYLAGSGCFTDACVGVAAGRFGLAAAVEMASVRPRELLGLPPADPGELVWFDWLPGGPVTVRQVIG